MHQRRQPTAPSLPAAHAAARVAANDDVAVSSALSYARRWRDDAHATEHRARPSIVAVSAALDAAEASPSPATFRALSLAFDRWCSAASGRDNAVDLAGAMLGAVNAAASLDAAAEHMERMARGG